MTPYEFAWRSSDGNYGGMVRVVPPDAPYPAAVKVELYDPANSIDLVLTTDDTWALIRRLMDAAVYADGATGKLVDRTPTAVLKGETF